MIGNFFQDLRRFLSTKTKNCCNVSFNWSRIKLEAETFVGRHSFSINFNIRTTRNIFWKVIADKKIVYNRHPNYFQIFPVAKVKTTFTRCQLTLKTVEM